MSRDIRVARHSEETRQLVKELLLQKLTAGKIGQKVGLSKNAVIGLVKRDPMLSAIGFYRNGPGGQPPKRVEYKHSPRPRLIPAKNTSHLKTPPKVEFIPETREDEPPSLKRDCLDVGHDECRWVHGDPKNGEWNFCGHPVHKKSYCSHHYDRIYHIAVWHDYKKVMKLR